MSQELEAKLKVAKAEMLSAIQEFNVLAEELGVTIDTPRSKYSEELEALDRTAQSKLSEFNLLKIAKESLEGKRSVAASLVAAPWSGH